MVEIKNDERIAKDKEAVAKMAGAKDAMAAALRRIETLEMALKAAQRQFTDLAGGIGDGLHIQIVENSSWKAAPLKGELVKWSAAITKVL